MLRAAFGVRDDVPGTRVHVTSPEVTEHGLRENEEVVAVWSRQRYVGPARLLASILPRLMVMVLPRGGWELDPDVRPDLQGQARWMAQRPPVTWRPALMRR